MNLNRINIKNKMKFWKISLLSSLIIMNLQCTLADIQIGMRALVLSTEKPDSILLSLASYGIPYDNLIYNCDNPLGGELYLLDETTGNPKYNMIIVANGQMKSLCMGSMESALSPEHWKALDTYEAKYHIRRVTIDELPEDAKDIGVALFEYSGEKKSVIAMSSADTPFTKDLFNKAGIHTTAPFNTNGIQYKLAKITDSKISTPVLYYDVMDGKSKEKAVAAVYSTLSDGRERLTFFTSSSKRSPTSLIINHLWIPWASKYLYSGFRRVYFTQHIDDMLSSEVLIPVPGNRVINNEYRTTKEDIENLIQYQNEIVKKMPKGSTYHLEFAFNGFGVIKNSRYNFLVLEDRNIPDDYIKPRGLGICKWPEYPFHANWLESELLKDSLYAYLKNEDVHEQFYWTSHGFTHQRLNVAMATDVLNQIETNIKMAIRLGFYEKDIYSKHTMITPHGSGLHNGDALEAFVNSTITSAAGVLHRPDINNDERYERSVYVPWRTTEESSNYKGFPVIPRIPTMLFHQCSTAYENTVKYNRAFEGTGMLATFDDILNRDTQQALVYLLQLRHNPFIFHQANLRSSDIPGHKSLVGLWTEKLLEKYNQYVQWPMVSKKVDDIHESFLSRESFEKCDLEQHLNYDGSKIVSVTLTSHDRSCKVPLALPTGVSIMEDDLRAYKDILSIEQVSEVDPITLWVALNDSSVTLRFNPAISWGEYKEENVNNTEALTKKEVIVNIVVDDSPKPEGSYSVHDIVVNVLSNILEFRLKTEEMKDSFGYSTEQMKNSNAFHELEKSRKYADGVRIQEKAKEDKKVKEYLNSKKEQFDKSIGNNLE